MLPDQTSESKEYREYRLSYQEAYERFRDRDFLFSLHEDSTDVRIPVGVDVKSFETTPDTCFVYLEYTRSKVHMFWPWLRVLKERVSESLDLDEISWIIRFLDHRGERLFDERPVKVMWALETNDFHALETLLNEKPSEIKKIIGTLGSDQPTDLLLKAIETNAEHS